MEQAFQETYKAESFNLDFDLIKEKVDILRVIKEMGYPKGAAPPEMIEMVKELLDEARNHIQLQCGYVWLPPGDISGDGGHIYLKGRTFDTKRIVGVPLKKMEEAVLFVGTVGHGFDTWSRGTFDGGDPIGGYIIDLLGSEFAERVADWTEAKVVERATAEGKKCSNRYSPGYCGWSVAEQHQLFSFFPKDFCTITLTDSALMSPHKSVSGIIGISKVIKRMEYPCDVCRVKHCYKNRNLT